LHLQRLPSEPFLENFLLFQPSSELPSLNLKFPVFCPPWPGRQKCTDLFFCPTCIPPPVLYRSHFMFCAKPFRSSKFERTISSKGLDSTRKGNSLLTLVSPPLFFSISLSCSLATRSWSWTVRALVMTADYHPFKVPTRGSDFFFVWMFAFPFRAAARGRILKD